MNKIIVTNRNGVTQHARLIGTSYADEWDISHHQPSAYIAGLDYDWYDYVHLQDIVAYWFWYENLTNVNTLTLCQIAFDCDQHGRNLFKGWAALKLLTEDLGELSGTFLGLAIGAALRHTETLVGRNALQLLQWESDYAKYHNKYWIPAKLCRKCEFHIKRRRGVWFACCDRKAAKHKGQAIAKELDSVWNNAIDFADSIMGKPSSKKE